MQVKPFQPGRMTKKYSYFEKSLCVAFGPIKITCQINHFSWEVWTRMHCLKKSESSSFSEKNSLSIENNMTSND